LLETRSAKERKETVARYALVGYPLFVKFDFGTKRSRRAVLALAAARLRGASRGFRRACHQEIAVVEGPRRNLWATRWTGSLSVSELEEMNRLFLRQIALLKPKGSAVEQRRKYYELTFVLAPMIPQPGNSPAEGNERA
ncbi:MAG: hypothetical protein ACRD3Q_17765, partial [Terriglobales bacterium]